MEVVFTNQALIVCFQEIYKNVNNRSLKINQNNNADLLFALIKHRHTRQKHLCLKLPIVNNTKINLMVTLVRWE